MIETKEQMYNSRYNETDEDDLSKNLSIVWFAYMIGGKTGQKIDYKENNQLNMS
jgi:hypothetical protein